VGLLVLFAGVVLLFTGRYHKALYDFVLGMPERSFRSSSSRDWGELSDGGARRR
jgi:hypothetical protein